MKKLSIVGVGTKRFSQITLEALAQIQSSQAICYIENEVEIIKQYIKGSKHFVNLDPHYKTDRTDLENYKAMMKAIISTLETFDHVSFILAGHPRLGVFLTKALETWCRTKSIEISVFEGISSFDAMVNALELDILESGTSIIDINRALLYDHEINVQCDHFFYHICSVANPVADYQGKFDGNRLDLLKKYLLRFYPPEHPLALVKAANSANENSVIEYFTVGKVDQLKSIINFSTTLYIPAQKIKIANHNVLKIMKTAGDKNENHSIQ